jgi:3,4-dihydroxy 2-butanone 4-phosphate synthase/GTP cyclohydrolase II
VRSADHDVSDAVTALRQGRAVVLHGDRGELAGDHHLLLAAELASPHDVAFMVRHTSGFIRAILTQTDADRLELPAMYSLDRPPNSTSYAVTVDAGDNITTGISATDRCTTLRTLADPATVASQLRRPGHVVPVRAHDLGLIRRPGYAEAVVDLMRIAGLRPAGALSELVSDQGTPMSAAQADEFGRAHRLPVVSVSAILEHLVRTRSFLERVDEAHLAVGGDSPRVVAFRDRLDGQVSLALCAGRLDTADVPTLRVVHPDGQSAVHPDTGHGPAIVVYLGSANGSATAGAATLSPGTIESATVEEILVDLGVHHVHPVAGTRIDTDGWTRVAVRRAETASVPGRHPRLVRHQPT